MSSILNAGKGVFAKEFIPRRTRIGPYKGEVVQKEDVTDTSYLFEVTHVLTQQSVPLSHTHENMKVVKLKVNN